MIKILFKLIINEVLKKYWQNYKFNNCRVQQSYSSSLVPEHVFLVIKLSCFYHLLNTCVVSNTELNVLQPT